MAISCIARAVQRPSYLPLCEIVPLLEGEIPYSKPEVKEALADFYSKHSSLTPRVDGNFPNLETPRQKIAYWSSIVNPHPAIISSYCLDPAVSEDKQDTVQAALKYFQQLVDFVSVSKDVLISAKETNRGSKAHATAGRLV